MECNEKIEDASDDSPRSTRIDFRVRLWMMNSFFPSISDEYGAWKTAVPTMPFPKTAYRPRNDEDGDAFRFSKDRDAVSIQLETKIEKKTCASKRGTIGQLEMMSELAHPLWGLSGIRDCTSMTSELRHGAIKGLCDRTTDKTVALTIALAAIDAGKTAHRNIYASSIHR
jgi:hypothetical protein